MFRRFLTPDPHSFTMASGSSGTCNIEGFGIARYIIL